MLDRTLRLGHYLYARHPLVAGDADAIVAIARRGGPLCVITPSASDTRRIRGTMGQLDGMRMGVDPLTVAGEGAEIRFVHPPLTEPCELTRPSDRLIPTLRYRDGDPHYLYVAAVIDHSRRRGGARVRALIATHVYDQVVELLTQRAKRARLLRTADPPGSVVGRGWEVQTVRTPTSEGTYDLETDPAGSVSVHVDEAIVTGRTCGRVVRVAAGEPMGAALVAAGGQYWDVRGRIYGDGWTVQTRPLKSQR